ncbi:MAG: hypothetical protein CMH64_01385 [Nanoarchaeota archaeon]|nr:hypothetical protein [Nanoarchaeota archaeon]|tara:strand:- start:1206 stop:2090 length:885 start_codon:yes stop_codon:yes gene_type:complete
MAFKLKVKNLVTQLDIVTKGFTTSKMTGNYKSAFKGSGLEFDGFRKYMPEDDSSLIDWKASVRTNGLLIKEFKEERNLNIYFLFDVSTSMLFGSTERLKNQYGAELIASLSYASMQNDDSIGIGMFNDKIVRGIKPQSGEKQYYFLLGALTNSKLYGGRYDLNKALDFTLQFLEGSSLLFIVSDFIGLQKGWEKYIKKVSAKFDVIALMVRDPRDRELPEDVGDVVVEDPYGSEKLSLHPKSISKKYSKYVKKQEYQLEEVFKKAGSEFLSLSTDKDFVNPLIKMFARREQKFR